MTGNGEPVLTRRDCLLLAGLFCVALAIRFYFLQFYRVISSDGVSYALIARDFAAGHGLGGAVHYPPFFPILMGIVHLAIPDIELAGRLTAMVMGSLLVVPLYLLGREFFDRRVALFAVLLAISWPSLRHWSNEVMTQSTYITLALTGVWLVWRSWRNGSWRAAIAGGVCMAMAHLTRSEGVVLYSAVTVLLAGGTIALRQPRVRLLYLLAGWLVFCVLCSPYVLFLHDVTGKWELTGKGRVSIADALSEYLGRPDLSRDPSFREIGLLDLLRNYPDYLWKNTIKNLGRFWREFLPVYLWLMAFAGFMSGGWRREKLLERAYLAATFAPLVLIVVVFLMGPEYTQPYLPVMFLWCGAGVAASEKFLFRLTGVARRASGCCLAQWAPLTLGAAGLIALFQLAGQVPDNPDQPYNFMQDGGRYDQKRVGLMLAKELPPGARIMTRWGRIGFYTGRKWIDMPQAPLPEILAAARKGGARYIVVDGLLAGTRPQLGVLLLPVLMGPDTIYKVETGSGYSPLPGVKLFLLYRDPSSLGVAVYELVD